MFTGILQKLHHKKAVVRLNLLRIVRSISDPNEEQAVSIRGHSLFEAIEALAESDSAVLVRNMASELVKSTIEKENENGSGGRNRPSMRRTSSITPPSLHPGISTPSTPTHGSRAIQSKAFAEGVMSPRRGTGMNTDTSESMIFRPKSRDGPSRDVSLIGRRTSVAEVSSVAAPAKSRLPRTAALRPSRSSMAAPTIRDDEVPPPSRKTTGLRIRGEAKSVASPAQSPVSHLSSKRKPRPPSSDTKWS